MTALFTTSSSKATLANLNLAVVEYALGCEAEDNRKAEGNGYIVLGNGAHYPADEDYSFKALAKEDADYEEEDYMDMKRREKYGWD